MRERWRVLGLAIVLVAAALAGCAGPDATSDAKLLERKAHQAALPIDTPSEARAAGYQPQPHCVPDMGVHWVNQDLLDTELNVTKPEAVLFLPQSQDVDNTSASQQRFLGVEYIAVTQGTQHNTSDDPPRIEGIELDGPMPGHSPGMPWHADLHVWLADGLDTEQRFPSTIAEIDCPAGTTPPGQADDPARQQREAQPATCRETFTGRTVHEHARIEIYLNSSRPYDLSPERYQLAHRLLHFEAGELDAGGATIHIHQARPTMGCLLETLGWSVSSDRIVTDQHVVYHETREERFEVFVDGQRQPEGLDTPLRGGHTFVLRFDSPVEPSPCPNITPHTVHEHAQLNVHLNSSHPWDFSPARYQHQAGFVQFEDGPQDADGARIHVHKSRPSLSCLFRTLGWEVSEDRIETDTNTIFEATDESPIEVLVNGDRATEGFGVPIRKAFSYEVRYNATSNASNATSGS